MQMLLPPSTARVCPVMKEASSEAKKAVKMAYMFWGDFFKAFFLRKKLKMSTKRFFLQIFYVDNAKIRDAPVSYLDGYPANLYPAV